MFPDQAAAAELTQVPDSWLTGAQAIHLSAYSMVGPPWHVLRRAADLARAEGAIITLDASSVALIDSVGPENFRALISTLHPTYVFANGTEADTGSLRELTDTTLVIKNGSEPTEIHYADTSFTTVQVPPVDDVRDTTGAGDAFAAAFLSAKLDNADDLEAVEAGHMLARKVLAEPGANLTTHETGAVRD